MGLMKLSTYYKNCGDHVTFFKGNLKDLVLNDTYEMLKAQLYANDDSVFWELYKPQICEYLKKGTIESLDDVPGCDTNPIIKDLFRYYRHFFYRKDYFKPQFRKYDRVGVTTLFTFYWDIKQFFDTLKTHIEQHPPSFGDMEGNITDSAKSAVMGELHRAFRPEFLNRLDEMILFKPLTKDNLTGIIDIMVEGLKKRLADRSLKLCITDKAKELIIERGYDPLHGARPLRWYLQSSVETLLARAILSGNLAAGSTLTVDVENDELVCR